MNTLKSIGLGVVAALAIVSYEGTARSQSYYKPPIQVTGDYYHFGYTIPPVDPIFEETPKPVEDPNIIKVAVGLERKRNHDGSVARDRESSVRPSKERELLDRISKVDKVIALRRKLEEKCNDYLRKYSDDDSGEYILNKCLSNTRELKNSLLEGIDLYNFLSRMRERRINSSSGSNRRGNRSREDEDRFLKPHGGGPKTPREIASRLRAEELEKAERITELYLNKRYPNLDELRTRHQRLSDESSFIEFYGNNHSTGYISYNPLEKRITYYSDPFYPSKATLVTKEDGTLVIDYRDNPMIFSPVPDLEEIANQIGAISLEDYRSSINVGFNLPGRTIISIQNIRGQTGCTTVPQEGNPALPTAAILTLGLAVQRRKIIRKNLPRKRAS